MLLEDRADPNAVDRDGQTAWAWAEAKGSETMMGILRQYGGNPLPVWSLKVEPGPNEMLVSCTNLAGEIVYRRGCALGSSVADVVGNIAQRTGKAVHLILPNNHILGVEDQHLRMKDLLDSPPPNEKRKDPKDGHRYTKREFFKYYGSQEGQLMWDLAGPDEMEVACAQSLVEIAEVENAMVSEALLRSHHECDGHGNEVGTAIKSSSACPGGLCDKLMTTGILVLGFNKHPVEFSNAICESTPAQTLRMRGIDISPEWANGAKILIEGLTPSMMKEAGFAPEGLHLWHVVLFPNNENDVLESLMHLSYRMRPRKKTRQFIGCQKAERQDLLCETSPQDDLESLENHALGKEDGAILNQLCEGFCITRTFIDVAKHLRVGWSPRSMYTKSSNDRHEIENPRKWK